MINSFRAQPKDNFILFIDLLGVKNQIKIGGTSVLSAILKGTVNETKRVMKISNIPINGAESIYFKMFSDNMIFCTESNWKFLLLVAAGLQKHLVTFGIFLRGSLCFGSVCAEKDFVLGEGLVHAYELEAFCAKKPIIIVDTSFIEAIGKIIPIPSNNYEKVIAETEKTYFAYDGQGKRFIDYLNEARLTYGINSGPMINLMIEHQFRIKANPLGNENKFREKHRLLIDKHTEKIYKKFVWCRDYHNNFCQKHSSFEKLVIDENIDVWCDDLEKHMIELGWWKK